MANETDFSLEDMKEIVDEFLVEADELTASLDTNLVKLESTPDDVDLLNEIFRAAHTIKGTSSFLGLDQITTLTHKMEDVLNRLRKSELQVTPAIMDILLKGLDSLRQLLDNVREGKEARLDFDDLLRQLEDAFNDRLGGDDPPEKGSTRKAKKKTSGRKKQPVKKDSAGSNAGKPVEAHNDPQTAAITKHLVDKTLRVDVDRLDALMNLMGELVLSRNSLVQTVNKMTTEPGPDLVDEVNRSTAAVNYITTELQLAVMKMRMQPIGKVFSRFPRLVRDLGRDFKKDIELIVSGEETELDKSVIEEMGDPLIHILRNSCDHGIETPEQRKTAGKPARGTIHLVASQEGSNIVIKISDDGRGLDGSRIIEKAIERGLTTPEEAGKLSKREIFNFIFEAGFSTAKKATDVSGRGVGMDVVRTNIERLNGLIDLDSTPGKGTTITIKLPLTLAIIQGLLVECDREIFILPLSSVFETVRTDPDQIYYMNHRPVFRLRDEIIPVINLNSTLNRTSGGIDITEKPYIVIVGLAEKKLGLNIDRFLGQEEVVIKSLGDYLGNTEGVAGATILGDGRIRLIVDLIGLFSLANKAR
jgi:two-component system chemotaxis sensor kinase CheA